jgi:threonyl-tRNA synthetase
MLIVGDKEVETQQVAVRSREAGDLGQMHLDALLERLAAETSGEV